MFGIPAGIITALVCHKTSFKEVKGVRFKLMTYVIALHLNLEQTPIGN